MANSTHPINPASTNAVPGAGKAAPAGAGDAVPAAPTAIPGAGGAASASTSGGANAAASCPLAGAGDAAPGTPRHFQAARKSMHYLKEPHGFISGMTQGNLGYQMAYTAELLEEQLVAQGHHCVLQLEVSSARDGWCSLTTHRVIRGLGAGGRRGPGSDVDWANPGTWRLRANGIEVASGTGEFALECFQASATAFLEQCRAAVSEVRVPKLEKREYELLKIAQRLLSVS